MWPQSVVSGAIGAFEQSLHLTVPEAVDTVGGDSDRSGVMLVSAGAVESVGIVNGRVGRSNGFRVATTVENPLVHVNRNDKLLTFRGFNVRGRRYKHRGLRTTMNGRED